MLNYISTIVLVIASIVTYKMCSKFLLVLSIQASVLFGDPLVQLPSGWIRGRKDLTFQNTTFYAFEKIPYAAPPIGNFRFKPPQPPPNWDGILNTLDLDVVCYQLARPGPESEDCLYLNVFTPSLPKNDSTSLLPVIFYIHGGGYYDGSGRKLGPDLFVTNNIIYVVINYRLGLWGFLSTGDSVIPGNNGLKDSLFALEWVHDNIKLFGGDSDRVTIVGHSAGAASVAFLQLSRRARGLFSGAIIQSGTALGSWAYQIDPRENAFNFAKLLNQSLDFDDSESLREYLIKVPPEDLKKVSNDLYYKRIFGNAAEYVPSLQGLYFGIVLEPESEDAFITEKFYESYRDGKFAKVPLLIGFTSEECIEYYSDVNATLKAAKDFDEHLDWLVPQSMNISDPEKKREMGRFIRDIYTNGEPFATHVADTVRVCSIGDDLMLEIPEMKHAELYSKFAETYFYVFSYDGKYGGIDVHLDGADTVGHGEENKFLICSGAKCDLSNYPEADQITQNRLIKIWGNFAKFRNPTPNPEEILQNLTWPKLSTTQGDFLYVDIGEELKIKNHPSKTYEKWNKLYNSLGRDDFVTY